MLAAEIADAKSLAELEKQVRVVRRPSPRPTGLTSLRSVVLTRARQRWSGRQKGQLSWNQAAARHVAMDAQVRGFRAGLAD